MENLTQLFQKTFFGNTILQFILFFGSVIVGILLGKICYFLFKNQLRRLAKKSKTKFDDYLIDILEEPIVLLLVTAGFWVGQFFLDLNAFFDKLLSNVVFVLVSMTITWFIIRFIDMIMKEYVEPLVEKSESKLDDQILPIISKSTKTVVFLLAIIIVLSNLGYDILSLLTGLGIGGLAFALAAQDLVKNIIGGVSIFWDKPFQIDDWVEVNGKSGSIKEVGLRTTRITTLGGTTIVVPNSHVANSMIENYSTRNRRRMAITIGLVYETSHSEMEKAIAILQETIKNIDGVSPEDILIRFVNFGPYSLDLEAVYYIIDMDNWRMVIHNVNMAIKKNLEEASIDMAFPTQTHYVINQK